MGISDVTINKTNSFNSFNSSLKEITVIKSEKIMQIWTVFCRKMIIFAVEIYH